MAHIRKEERGVKMSDYVIYAIVSPFDNKEIYIARTGPKRLYKAYVEHKNFRVTKTRELFQRAAENELQCPIYRLEEGRAEEKEAFRRCVAWVKYFQKHGYEQVFADVLGEYAEDLKPETQEYYTLISELPLEKVLTPEGGLYPNYNKQREKKENDSTVISIRVNPEEYEQIRKGADEIGISLGAYCKRMTLNGTITQVDLSFIDKEIEEYQVSKSLLRQILFKVYTSGNYFPADMQIIQNCTERFTELQEKLCDKFTELIHNLR